MTPAMLTLLVAAAALLLATLDGTNAQASNFRCNDLCFSAKDGVCDDGGPGSLTGACPWGSDCADCGTRPDYTRRPTMGIVPTLQPSTQPPSTPTVQATAAPVASTSAPTRKPSDPAAQLTLKPTQKATSKPTLSPEPATESPVSSAVDSTESPSKAPTTKSSVCSKLKNKNSCCAPTLAIRRVCQYQGCRWLASKRRCIPDTSNFNPATITKPVGR